MIGLKFILNVILKNVILKNAKLFRLSISQLALFQKPLLPQTERSGMLPQTLRIDPWTLTWAVGPVLTGSPGVKVFAALAALANILSACRRSLCFTWGRVNYLIN